MHSKVLISARYPYEARTMTGRESLGLVHRTRPVDAFPNGWAQVGENRFLVTAQWQNDHSFFAPVHGGMHDPLMVVETIRQAAMLIIHAGYGVPTGYHFLLGDLTYDCDPDGIDATAAVSGIELELVFSELKRQSGQLSRLRIDMVLRRGGRVIATSALSARVTSPGVYRRLRGDGPFPPAPKHETPAVPTLDAGRTSPSDVLLTPTAQERMWQLRVDTGHRTLFQRPKDHVPGMVLLEAARQAASVIVGPFVPAGGSIEFHRYAEFARPCWIRAEIVPAPDSGTTAVRVTGDQDGEAVFHTELLAPARVATRSEWERAR